MEGRNVLGLAFMVASLASLSRCVPKKYDPTGGFLPSPVSYFPQTGDQVAVESKVAKIEEIDAEVSGNDVTAEERTQQPRFGIQTGGTLSTSSTGLFPGLNTGPLKLDLGGLFLGAVIGFGAVFVLPKILHVFSTPGGYDGYRRSEDGSSKESSLMQILARLDDTLTQYNIDSSSCVQRAVCSYVKSAAAKVSEGSASNFDTLLDSASNNSVLGYMLDGTSIKQAVELGRQGGDCSGMFAKCPFNKESVFAALKGLMSDQQ